MATGFPAGQTHLKTRLEEIRLAVEDGATEIDVVINRTLVLTGQWKGKCTCLPKKRLSYSLVRWRGSEKRQRGLEVTVLDYKSLDQRVNGGENTTKTAYPVPRNSGQLPACMNFLDPF